MSDDAPLIEYRVGQIDGESGFAVLIRHRDHPLWWRIVAAFANRERAERYAEIEQDCFEDDSTPMEDEVDACSPPTIAEPASAIRLENFVKQANPPDGRPAVEVPAPEPRPEPKAIAAPLAKAPKPAAVQERPSRHTQLLDYLNDLRKSGGTLPSQRLIAETADIPQGSLGAAWDRLESLGLILRIKDGDRFGVRFPDDTELWATPRELPDSPIGDAPARFYASPEFSGSQVGRSQ